MKEAEGQSEWKGEGIVLASFDMISAMHGEAPRFVFEKVFKPC